MPVRRGRVREHTPGKGVGAWWQGASGRGERSPGKLNYASEMHSSGSTLVLGKGSCRILHQVGSLLLEVPYVARALVASPSRVCSTRGTTHMRGKPQQTGECSCSDVMGRRDSAHTRDASTHLHGFPPLEVLILGKAHIKLERHHSWCSRSWGGCLTVDAGAALPQCLLPLLALHALLSSTQVIPIHPAASTQSTPTPLTPLPSQSLLPCRLAFSDENAFSLVRQHLGLFCHSAV